MHAVGEGKTSKSEAIHIPAKVTDKPILEVTIVIMNDNTHLNFTDKIKYPGSTIATNLRDEIDVATRIAIAHSQITQMRELFNCRDVSVATKEMTHRAILISTVLCGCETLAHKEKGKRKLEAFHHTAIRRILGMSTRRVREERITNKMVRSNFMGIPPILYFYSWLE
jgi:hypothetical protein